MLAMRGLGAGASALIFLSACATARPPPEKDDCYHRREAKPADWLDVDQPAKLLDDAPIAAEMEATGWLGTPRIAHTWVGVDFDGSVFCTRIDQQLGPRLDRAVRRALEAGRYQPAIVLGVAHYSFLHVDVRLYTQTDDEACSKTAEACWLAARAAANAADHARELELINKACDGGLAGACTSAGRALQKGHGAAVDVAAARALFERACKSKDGDGCDELGRLAFEARDYRRALELFQEGCALLDGGACNMLGVLYARGLGVPASQERAVALFDEACARHSLSACGSLGSRLVHGRGAARDDARGLRLLERVCAKNPDECSDYATALFERGDKDRAMALWQRECARGEALGCVNALEHGGAAPDAPRVLDRVRAECAAPGINEDSCWHAGELVLLIAKDDEDAGMQLLEKACRTRPGACADLLQVYDERGDRAAALRVAEAGCRLGGTTCWRFGVLVEDPLRDRALQEEMCPTGNARACMRLAELLYPVDPARARDLATTTCRTERIAHGCHILARLAQATGPPEFREAQAAALLREACGLGDGEACAELGARYREGRGVGRDDTKAAEFSAQGCVLDKTQCRK